MLFTDATAAELLATPGQADAIAVTADPGVSQADIAAAVQAAVGGDVEVITGATLIAENQAALGADFAEFETISLVFAIVAVFVGAFIINNTFSITVAQRTREMAMLRAIGASGRQVKRSVLGEAVVVGVLASGLGLVAGIGVAAGLRQLMSAFGFDMPDGPTVIAFSAMALSFAVGVVVTVGSAWLPARRAAKIAPIAALREVSVDRSAGSARRAVAGSVVTAAGVAALLAGLGGELALVGVGALTTFVGVSVLGPVLARPVASMFGLPLRMRGLSGELATRNAMRNPKRTARTASSLMIGVGAGRVHHGVRRFGEDLDGRLARVRVHRDAHRRGRSDGQLVRAEPRPGRRTARHRWCRRRHPGPADPGDHRWFGDGCVQRLRRHDRRRDVRAR